MSCKHKTIELKCVRFTTSSVYKIVIILGLIPKWELIQKVFSFNNFEKKKSPDDKKKAPRLKQKGKMEINCFCKIS